jgi:hypothetical protein
LSKAPVVQTATIVGQNFTSESIKANKASKKVDRSNEDSAAAGSASEEERRKEAKDISKSRGLSGISAQDHFLRLGSIAKALKRRPVFHQGSTFPSQ